MLSRKFGRIRHKDGGQFSPAVEEGLSESLEVNKANRQSPAGNNTDIFSTRTCSLNINKALQNKLNSCDSVRVEYEVTDGGITGCMDTGTFELFRLPFIIPCQ